MKKRFDYALVLLEHLKKQRGGFTDVKKVAVERRMPAAYLEKVAQELKRAGWLEAKRGAGGGYRLLEERARVSVTDLISFYEPMYSFCPALRKEPKEKR